MSIATKSKGKTRAKPVKRLRFRRDLPSIPPESPLYGHDDLIGCVSIKAPVGSAARRAYLRSRIDADNYR